MELGILAEKIELFETLECRASGAPETSCY